MSKKQQSQFFEEFVNELDEKEFNVVCEYIFDKKFNYMIFRPED